MVLLTSWPTVTDDSGTKTDGTIFNKALTDAIKAEIERLIHSTTNTTVSPEDIIDEVVTARGSKASLDARLDVSMNDDGTMKANAANLSTSNYTEGIGSRNVAVNGDFDDWTSGASSAPDNWTLSGAGAAVARTGPGEADTFTFGSGNFACKVTRAAADAALTQTVIAAGDWADYEDIEDGIVAIAANVKSALTSHARVQLNDGFATASSDYHTGTGSAQWLTKTLTIDASATKLEAILQVNNSAGAATFGGVMVVFSNAAPTRWQPLSRELPANATRSGLVSIGDQTFAGVKSFTGHPRFEPGTSSGTYAQAHGRIHYDVTTIGNVGAGPDTLMTHDIPIGVFDENGRGVRITACGTGANNANAKNITWKFDGTSCGTSGSFTTDAANGWWLDVTIIREDATHAKVAVQFGYANTSVGAFSRTFYTRVTVADFTTARTFLVEATTCTANNDIVQEMMVIRAD